MEEKTNGQGYTYGRTTVQNGGGMKVSAAFFKAAPRYSEAGSTDRRFPPPTICTRTSAVMLEELWETAGLEAVYTIGLAEPGALAYIYNLRCICYHTEPYMPDAGGMQALELYQAIRYLCACEKEPSLERR